MRSTFHTLFLGAALALTSGASAQNYVSIMGQVVPCMGVSYPVHVQTWPGVLPAMDTIVYTGSNCMFSVDYFPNSTVGYLDISVSCDGGLTYTTDSASFNIGFLNTDSIFVVLACGGGVQDCNGVLNGPDMPGTACNDNNAWTINDTWSANCVCIGDSSGTWDCLQIWNGPNMPGTACNDNDPLTFNDTWSASCVCAGQDSSGTWDCLQIWNGPNMPGTPCVNLLGDTGVWSTQCLCQTNSNTYDCMGILNGNNLPGTPCIIPGTILIGTWSASCVCDTNSTYYDCLGILNGTNLPGTSCDDGNPLTLNDTWSANCVCTGTSNTPCQANFWVLQAYGIDSLPVPYELWVWNLSSGGSGVYTFQWSFGDGTSSVDPFPTHTYSGSGPYVLCLTINDGNGCLSTHCDSVSIDNNGMYTGMMGDNNQRSGFTINVRDPLANSITDLSATEAIALWPNPVEDALNIAINSNIAHSVDLVIYDMNGKAVWNGNKALSNGRNSIMVPVESLEPGMYVVRIGSNANVVGMRFVKR